MSARISMSLLLALTPCLGVSAAPAPPKFDPGPHPGSEKTSIKLLLNEVMFDAPGRDGSKLGREYIELIALQHMNLAGYTLTGSSGIPLAALPRVEVDAGCIIVVYLSTTVPAHLDADPVDGSMAIAAGLTLGDHLDNDSDCVKLQLGGSTIDQLSWGSQGTPGAGPCYFDLSFGSGQPIREGESLGRAWPLDYTGTANDWSRQGGANAVGPTPGGTNEVHVSDPTNLTAFTQAGINQILLGFSAETGMWLSITNADVASPLVTEEADDLTVSAMHLFAWTVRGQPMIVTGIFDSSHSISKAPGALGYTISFSGQLSSAWGYSCFISHEETFDGFESGLLRVRASTEVVWQEPYGKFPFSIDGVMEDRFIATNVRRITDEKTTVDFGGAGSKTSHSECTLERLGDGQYRNAFYMIRPFPMGPPAVETFDPASPQTILFEEILDSTASVSSNDDDEFQLTWDAMNYARDSVPTFALAAGAVGTMSYTKSGNGDMFQLSLPMNNGQIGVTMSCAGIPAPGKLLHLGTVDFSVDGNSIGSFAFAVDPPQGQGQGPPQPCPHSGVIHICTWDGNDFAPEPPPEPVKPPPPEPKPPTVGGALEAAAACGAIGAGAGSLAPGIGTAVGGFGGGCLCLSLYLFGVWDVALTEEEH